MSKAKYIISFFLFLSVFLFIGESYTFFLENFETKYVQVGYYLMTGDSEEEMNKYIADKAEEFGTEVFAIEKEDNGAYNRTITFYADEPARRVLKKDWNIEEGTVKSFFSGKTAFHFEPFDKAGEKALEYCWYPSLTTEEAHAMCYPYMADYSGSIRNDPMKSTENVVAAGTWLLAILALLLLTAYDISYSRKEQSVRIILGADSRALRNRKIVKDVIGFTIASAVAFLLLVPFTTPTFQLKVSIVCFICFLLTNSLLLALGMRVKKGIYLRQTHSNKILAMTLTLKGFVAVITVIVLSVTIGLSIEGVKLYAQKDYYGESQHSAHVDFGYPLDYEKMVNFEGGLESGFTISTDEQIIDNFLRYSYNHLECSLMYASAGLYNDVAPKYGENYVQANLNGLKPYKDFIPDWEQIASKEGNYILIPEDGNRDEIIQEAREAGPLSRIDREKESKIITYKSGLSVIAEGRHQVELDYTFKIKEPIIFLDTYDYGNLPQYPVSWHYKLSNPKLKGMIYNDFFYLMQFVKVNNAPDKINEFVNDLTGDVINPNLMEIKIQDVDEWYNGLWALQNRSLLIAVILTLLLLILEVQITILSLRMAYETNAKELTIKKVIGYSIFERFRGFFLLSGILCSLSLLGATCIWGYFGIGLIGYFIWGSLIVWILDWCVLLILSKRIDRMQIQKILKGGI